MYAGSQMADVTPDCTPSGRMLRGSYPLTVRDPQRRERAPRHRGGHAGGVVLAPRRLTKPEKKTMRAMGVIVPLDVILEDAGIMG
jgi:hypothetical protein